MKMNKGLAFIALTTAFCAANLYDQRFIKNDMEFTVLYKQPLKEEHCDGFLMTRNIGTDKGNFIVTNMFLAGTDGCQIYNQLELGKTYNATVSGIRYTAAGIQRGPVIHKVTPTQP